MNLTSANNQGPHSSSPASPARTGIRKKGEESEKRLKKPVGWDKNNLIIEIKCYIYDNAKRKGEEGGINARTEALSGGQPWWHPQVMPSFHPGQCQVHPGCCFQSQLCFSSVTVNWISAAEIILHLLAMKIYEAHLFNCCVRGRINYGAGMAPALGDFNSCHGDGSSYLGLFCIKKQKKAEQKAGNDVIISQTWSLISDLSIVEERPLKICLPWWGAIGDVQFYLFHL